MPTCRDVMTREPVYCAPSDPVTRAAELMRSHDVGSLPVVEPGDTGRLVGMVTDRDLVLKIVAGPHAAERATVRDAMTAEAWSCRADEDVSRAVSMMADKRVRRMPIVDGEGRLVGIIAEADVAKPRDRAETRTGARIDASLQPAAGRNQLRT